MSFLIVFEFSGSCFALFVFLFSIFLVFFGVSFSIYFPRLHKITVFGACIIFAMANTVWHVEITRIPLIVAGHIMISFWLFVEKFNAKKYPFLQ